MSAEAEAERIDKEVATLEQLFRDARDRYTSGESPAPKQIVAETVPHARRFVEEDIIFSVLQSVLVTAINERKIKRSQFEVRRRDVQAPPVEVRNPPPPPSKGPPYPRRRVGKPPEPPATGGRS